MNRTGVIAVVAFLALAGIGVGYFLVAGDGGSGPVKPGRADTAGPLQDRPTLPQVDHKAAPKTDGAAPVKVSTFNAKEDMGNIDSGVMGIVQNSSGAAVDSALCELVVDNSALINKPQENDVRAQCTTKGDGLFFFARQDLSTAERYVLRVSHPEYSMERYFPVELKDPKSGNLKVTLTTGAAISGTIHTASGAPLAGVTITAYDLNTNTWDPLGAVEKVATSDATGNYVVSNLKPGVKKLMARQVGFATNGRQTVNVEANKNVEHVDIIMGEGCKLGGLITSQETGTAVGGALVTARPLAVGPKLDPEQAKLAAREVRAKLRAQQGKGDDDGAAAGEEAEAVNPSVKITAPVAPPAMLSETVRTGDDGRFEFPGLECGSYVVSVAASGYMQAPQQTAETGSDGVNFQLVSNGRVLGRVVDDETGRPVLAFTIGFTTTPDDTYIAPHTKRSFSAPRFTDGKFEYIDVRPGKYWLLAEAPGYAGGKSEEITMNQSERRENVEIRLHRGATIRGRVVDNQGQGVADAIVTAEGAQPEGQPDNPFLSLIKANMRREMKEGRTDSKGNYTIPNLLEGRYALSVRHPTFGPLTSSPVVVSKGGEVSAPDLQLSRGCTIRGRVSTDGKPDPKAMVQVAPVATNGAGFGSQRTAYTDAEGHFEVTGLSIGTYRVTVAQRNGTIDLASILKQAKDGASSSAVFTLGEGEVKEVDL